MSWAALNGHVRDPPILDPASGFLAARENGEGGDRCGVGEGGAGGAGVGKVGKGEVE